MTDSERRGHFHHRCTMKWLQKLLFYGCVVVFSTVIYLTNQKQPTNASTVVYKYKNNQNTTDTALSVIPSSYNKPVVPSSHKTLAAHPWHPDVKLHKENYNTSVFPSPKTNITNITNITNVIERPSIRTLHKDVCFIKIHRVGSGTFHNILVRFAINHNAFVALNNKPWYEVFPYQISKSILLPQPQHPNFTGYNMLFDHVFFNKSASDAILQKNVVYITQIRDPFTHNPATFEKFRRWVHLKLSYSEFMKDPHSQEAGCLKSKPLKYSLCRNVMSLELGYTNQIHNNVTDFMNYLDILNKTLFHVSILEDLSASLILLKRKLHWEIKDLLFMRLHVHAKKIKEDPEARRMHRQWSSLDYALYDYFLARHKQEVEQQDSTFPEEVNTLIRVQDNFTNFCLQMCGDLAKVDKANTKLLRESMKIYQTIPASRFNKAFNVT